MRPLRWKLLPLGLLALLAGFSAGASAVRAFDGTGANQDDEQELGPLPVATAVPLADLSEIRFDPLSWKGREVRFVLQFRELVPDWDPYLTRFGTVDWVAFSGWSDTRFTWDAEVYDDPLPTLFVRRGSELAAGLTEYRPHQRLEARAWVREIFFDRPWIEITSLRPLEEHVGEGTILHVGRARDFMRMRKWELALQQFERAKAAPLPAHARAELERQIIECRAAREELSERD